MNFDLSDDDAMLKSLAERFVADRYDMERRRRYQSEPQGFDADNWRMLGELGLIAALCDSSAGGLGVGPAGLAALFEALGSGLAVEPLADSVMLAAGLFLRLAPSVLKSAWQADLVSGARRLALAHREHAARGNPDFVECRAEPNGSGIYLSGRKMLVPAGIGADAFVLSARSNGNAGDADGYCFYFVSAHAPGLTIKPWRLVDGSLAASVEMDHAPVAEAHILGGGAVDLRHVTARASLVQCAEALGIMQRLFDETSEYLRTRKQFGTPLSGFQLLQHRMVNHYASIEQARALLTLAIATDPQDEPGWLRAIDGARAFIAEASIALGHDMIQLHGGMGVTDELSIGHGHKRLMRLARYPDDAELALDRYAGVTG